MNAASQPVGRYRDLIDRAHGRLPGREIGWLEAQRRDATSRFAGLAFPTRKDEVWRYSNLDALLEHSFEPAPDVFAVPEQAAVDELMLCGRDSCRLVFINGRWAPALSSLDPAPPGVKVRSLQQALMSDPDLLAGCLGRAASGSDHVFSVLNTALLEDGLYLHIEAGHKQVNPIEVLYLTLSADGAVMAQPRNLIVLGNGACATLVEHYAAIGNAAYFNNALSEVLLGANAGLVHHRLQEEAPDAHHISTVYIRQEACSRYRGSAFALGAEWARTDYHTAFVEPGAESQINGLYVAGDRQLSDVHLDIHHKIADCTSEENFKGIVLGRGRAVFDARVRVDPHAQGSDAHVSNTNLLLSRNAEVDSKPQLEIYADDVKCSHGTTVGQLDPEQLFYLHSRGIGEAQARSMLCLGFASEILAGIGVPGLKQRVQSDLRRRLEGSRGDNPVPDEHRAG